jgi:hypothetical protein
MHAPLHGPQKVRGLPQQPRQEAPGGLGLAGLHGGRERKETLVMRPDHKEAMLMNILVEMEIRLRKLENGLKNDKW